MCYATELESAKLTALRTLAEILATTDDPTEKRRAATAILRLPDPKPARDTNISKDEPEAQARRSAPRADSPSTPPPTTLPTQQIEPKPHDSSPVLPHLPFHERLAIHLNPIPDPLSPPTLSPIQPLLAAAGRAAALTDSIVLPGPERGATNQTGPPSAH